MQFVWIPEAPEHPGLYANASDYSGSKIQGLTKQPSTMDPNFAHQFKTEAECQAWCDANPHPIFVPREHGFDIRVD